MKRTVNSIQNSMDGSTASERESLLGQMSINSLEPVDKFNAVYLIFVYLGIACLLPWNFFITANDYFQYKLRNTSLPDNIIYNDKKFQTDDQRYFESYLSLSAMITNFVFMVITTMFIRSIPVNPRIVISMLIVILVFAETSALVLVDSDEWQSTFLTVTLVSAGVIMASVSVFTGSIIGLSCLFPTRYIQALMLGQALGGTFSALANILSIMGKGSVIDNAFGYFLTATVISLLSLVAYGLLYKLKFSKYYLSNIVDTGLNTNTEIPTYKEAVGHKEYFLSIITKSWHLSVTVCLIFIVTLICFPSLASAVIPMKKYPGDPWTNSYFSPVGCFLMFNLGDFLSRFLTNCTRPPSIRMKYFLMFVAVLRILFVPLLMYCNNGSKHLPVIFDNDAYPIVFVLLLGLTNGFIGTICMMYAPIQVPVEQAEGAGVFMSLSLTTGLTLGSVLSLEFVNLIK